MNLEAITDADYDSLANQIEDLSKQKEESEMLKSIGKALDCLGLTAKGENNELLKNKVFNEDEVAIHIDKLIKYVSEDPINDDEAMEEGKNFWERFKAALKQVICSNEKLLEYINGDSNLKEFLKQIVPQIFKKLGVASPSQILILVIATALALLLKGGLAAYCGIDAA